MSLRDPTLNLNAQVNLIEHLIEQYATVRERTRQLVAPLSEEDCCVQSMPDASPAKWHLAHTTWFFETFILEKIESSFKPFHSSFRVLFNSYYEGIGKKHPRPQRGMLTRPSLAEVQTYRENVDERIQKVLLKNGNDKKLAQLIVLGLHHEQQHQELLLTDIKHLFSLNPLRPAYHDIKIPSLNRIKPLEWIAVEGGLVGVGHQGESFHFDNEQPRHKQFLQPYLFASRLVTNSDYLAFIEAGGYQDPQLWLSDGWNWVVANGIEHPIYWLRDEKNDHGGYTALSNENQRRHARFPYPQPLSPRERGEKSEVARRDFHSSWQEFTLSGVRPLDLHTPVVHLSYFEADAYARWTGARLPTEAEWEHVASQYSVQGNLAGNNYFHPLPAKGEGLMQIYGDVWEWTQSSYAPYPGFRPALGAIGEYNGKFMVNQYVLRGGSCVTPEEHMRPSYRNFFPTAARWQFSGIRLAKNQV